jgi:hypothetical protein
VRRYSRGNCRVRPAMESQARTGPTDGVFGTHKVAASCRSPELLLTAFGPVRNIQRLGLTWYGSGRLDHDQGREARPDGTRG